MLKDNKDRYKHFKNVKSAIKYIKWECRLYINIEYLLKVNIFK